MKFGAVFPQTEIGSDPAVIRDWIQAVEDMGYDYLTIYDHVLGANPDRPGGWKGVYTYHNAFHEPFVLFGYVAALTRRLELATGIIILPQRQTALAAKQAAEVDVLSGGRLRLGIAIGWNKVEYDALGVGFNQRGKRIEEQVLVLRELWTKPLVNFQGEFHTIEDAGINPLPIQRPIPLWFGGGADAVLDRMARLGDGWIANQMSIERAQPLVEQIHAYLEKAGRAPSEFGIDIRVNLSRQPQSEWADYMAGWRGLGATHFSVNTMGMKHTHVQQHLDALRHFIAEAGMR